MIGKMHHQNQIFDHSQHASKLQNLRCRAPLTDIQIYDNGEVCNCCFTWLPSYIGNVMEKPLREIVEGRIAEAVRTSVSDGTFKYCSVELCPSLSEAVNLSKVSLPLTDDAGLRAAPKKKLMIYLNYDRSCNLYCGSCRNDRILHTEETAPPKLRAVHENVTAQLKELSEAGYDLNIHLTGSGDPFASPMYWKFLRELPADSRYRLGLSTNGTLMTRERLSLPYAKKVEFIGVSVDAFTEATYAKVRRGGNFTTLRNNLDELNKMARTDLLPALRSWRINFVVQKDNFREMADFAKWALSFSTMPKVWFNLIADWGHLQSDQFNEKAIWSKTHPDHAEFIEVLQDPIFDAPRILIGNMSKYRAAKKLS